MTTVSTPKRKLIEVALPLEAINEESSKRKRKAPAGYPTTLHKWWAQRPLAACRAVLFASLVDDPSSHPDRFPDEAIQDVERQRLFRIIEELVKWENTNNEAVLGAARAEIVLSTGGNPPPMLDPFAGGGSIPLEAQRLGLEVHANDLNPVAVLINKALVEIPPKFAGGQPVNKNFQGSNIKHSDWKGVQGLAEDVRYYGKWMNDEAEKRIGHLFPKAQLSNGGEATVIAWLWARTVKCPNPACGAQMPLIRSFVLSSKKGKEVYASPVIDYQPQIPQISFKVKTGVGAPKHGTVERTGAHCIACESPVPLDHIRVEGRSGRMSAQLIAMVADGMRGRTYIEPTREHVDIAEQANPAWKPEAELQGKVAVSAPLYGMRTFGDLFTSRQLVTLTTFSDLVQAARQKVLQDALEAQLPETPESELQKAEMYADSVALFLAFALSRLADYGNTIASWRSKDNAMRSAFAKQALPMVWDYAEGNPFAGSSSGFLECVSVIAGCLKFVPAIKSASVSQKDAASNGLKSSYYLVSTDPPYYDNIGYADLSDFFYVWLRESLGSTFPDNFSTLLVPKAQELVATPYRFGGNKISAKKFFEKGLKTVFSNLREAASKDFPTTVYYAFKQSETDSDPGGIENNNQNIASTGWETMLEALLTSGFQINGTWPMRTEGDNRSVGIGTNALASSIVLVCRPRSDIAPTATRREFLTVLRRELPQALRELQQGSIAPVDLAQASIGPGMAVFSRYKEVLESDGRPMPVRAALSIINQMLDEVLAEQEGTFDADTRWALAWFEQFGGNDGAYGDAETLSKAKNTSVSGMVGAGIILARAGKVRLLKRSELPDDWNPQLDGDIPVWEATQHLVKRLEEGGEENAAALLAALGSTAEIARDLAYRLYSLCERKKWAQEALAYNALVSVWPELTKLAANLPQELTVTQPSAFGDV